MKSVIAVILLAALTACNPGISMNNYDLPEGWSVESKISLEESYEIPPMSESQDFFLLHGLRDDSLGFERYKIPKEVTFSQLVEYFKVGSHGAMFDEILEVKIVEQVSLLVGKIQKAYRCRAFYADAAGFKIQFLDQLNHEELDVLLSFFPNGGDTPLNLGLDYYISHADLDQHLFEKVLEDGYFHLWWD